MLREQLSGQQFAIHHLPEHLVVSIFSSAHHSAYKSTQELLQLPVGQTLSQRSWSFSCSSTTLLWLSRDQCHCPHYVYAQSLDSVFENFSPEEGRWPGSSNFVMNDPSKSILGTKSAPSLSSIYGYPNNASSNCTRWQKFHYYNIVSFCAGLTGTIQVVLYHLQNHSLITLKHPWLGVQALRQLDCTCDHILMTSN